MIVDNVASLPYLALYTLQFLLVMLHHPLRLLGKLLAALRKGQFHIGATLCKGPFLICVCFLYG